jgi:hypothetical protein
MNTLYKAIQSRTIWTIAVMFLIGGIQALQPIMDAETYVLLNGLMSLLAGYFRLNARA